ncbi:serine hydrolase domain-containing protein [Legionella cardiaca]|uniref:Serine hydrolase n=1 Tax=Legionella cardiaca TaxID=1071983 RepID=A0ABY8AYQ3_9GAMM|nr:serine hydrolase domain-containing protein [Legionella cardiaca]WED44601.1 serine hydrolase [Legionella cardiaca]
MTKILIKIFIIGLLNLLPLNANAGIPLFEVTAVTKAPNRLLANRILTVQYKIKNNSNRTRTLTIKPMPGTEQISGTSLCPNPFTLAPGQSCSLNLRLRSSQMGAGLHSGPIICQTKPGTNIPDPLLCYGPSATDSLDISVTPCTKGVCLNQTTEQLLRNITTSYKQQYNIPGVLAGIWIPGQGELVIEDGVADLSTERPISSADHVRIASLTKSFTTTVVLQLIQQGLTTLNTPISNFGFNIQNNSATLAMLANMRSGIFNYSADPNFLQALVDNFLRKWSPQELVTIANSNNVYFPPNANWHYSNTNTIILGMIIEQLTGNFVGNEISNRIIKPLGLSETSYPTTPNMPIPFVRGYAGTDREDVTFIDPSFSGAAGGMISTLGDLRIWVKALATGSLLSPLMQQQRVNSLLPISFNPCADNDPTRPHPTCPEYDKYGYGMGAINGWIGHTGDYFGYLLLMMHEPHSGATVVIIVNISGVGAHIPTDLFREYLNIITV